MSLSDRVKNFLGLSPVRTVIDCPTRFSVDQKTIDGRITIVGLRDCELEEVKMEVVQAWSETDEESGVHEKFREVLGTDLLLNQTMPLAEGQEITCEFSIPFQVSWDLMDDLKMKNGLLGGLGKVASLLFADDSQELFTYSVAAVINRRPDPVHEQSLIRIDWGPLKRDHGQS